ncbi:hypothetical protein GC194_09650 [bacterium]|nr:hypothetical protein [bacterium]
MVENAILKIAGFEPVSQSVAVHLPVCKSLSNRALILHFLHNKPIDSLQLSTANDTALMRNILESFYKSKEIDVADAGTVARFIMALCAVADTKTRTIYGSARMHERPMKALSDSLTMLGAKVEFLAQPGFLPLKITGTDKPATACEIDPTESSQFVSAILLLAPLLPLPFTIFLTDKITSKPYAEMTMGALKQYGYLVEEGKNQLRITKYKNENSHPKQLEEADWSAAIYFLFINALIETKYHTEAKQQSLFSSGISPTETQLKQVTQKLSGFKIYLPGLYEFSLQGDRQIDELLSKLGLQLRHDENGFYCTQGKASETEITLNFADNPDLAQPFACYMAAAKIRGTLRGLHTLAHKETNRMAALQNELKKVGAKVETTSESLSLMGFEAVDNSAENQIFETYNDHRMAMSLFLLQIAHPHISMRHPQVVVKSFPQFWEAVKSLGFKLQYD